METTAMKKAIPSILSAAFLLSIPAGVNAQDCVNCWINPRTGIVEDLDNVIYRQNRRVAPVNPAERANQTTPQNSPVTSANQPARGNQTPAVIVYGRPTCGLTSGMMRQLDANKIPYEFRNVDSDEATNREMWTLIRNSGTSVGDSVRKPRAFS
jgi:hypothetical protein